MRPRKVILLVNADEVQLGIQRFMLETRGYRVLVAHDATAALALHALGVDLVLGFPALHDLDWEVLAERMKQTQPQIPIMLRGGADIGAANVAMCDATMSTVELMERARLLIRRTRRPRKAAVLPALAMAGD
jgi:two-component system response regulator CpxR